MTMHWIATQTATSATQLTFSSIPQTFTHLQLRIVGRDASATSLNAGFVVFNGTFDSYPNHYLVGNGSAITTAYQTSVLIPLPSLPGTSAAANMVGSVIIDILDYSNPNKNKTIRAIGGADLNGSGQVGMFSGFRDSTDVITSLTVGGAFTSPYQFAAGTRVDLYGITSNPIATGV